VAAQDLSISPGTETSKRPSFCQPLFHLPSSKVDLCQWKKTGTMGSGLHERV
jgi:hypothetical protein